MSLEKFLRWSPSDDHRYELFSGEVVAMTPPSVGHALLVSRLGRTLGNALASRPGCEVFVEAGIAIDEERNDYYQADLVVSCSPQEAGSQRIFEPLLIVEVLSPSTSDRDRMVKLPDYRALASVREILLLAQDRAYAELHRRHSNDPEMWITELVRGEDARLRLLSLDKEIKISLAELFEGI